MKHSYIFILAILFATTLFGQSKSFSPPPISNDEFQQKLNVINSKGDETLKLASAKQVALAYSLLTSQVKQMAGIFKSDINRLDFSKTAYTHTSDKINFYEVYDTFGYFSNVFKLHDFVKSNPVTQKNETKAETKPAILFPMWEYPNATFYKGLKGCPSILADKDFDAFTKQVFELTNESEKVQVCEKKFQSFCMSTAQIMKSVSLVNAENNRLNLLKKAFFHCYDVSDYLKADVCLSSSENKKILADYINNGLKELTGGNTPTPAPCEVLDKDYQEIKTVLKGQSFNNTRVNMCKQILSDKKCFTAFQIKEIIAMFDFEDSRLDVAKYSYDYCIDKGNFILKVGQSLEFPSSQDDLFKFVQAKK